MCVHEIPVQFARKGDAERVKDILAQEPLLEVVTEPQTITEAKPSNLSTFNAKLRQQQQQ